ncbi:MAG TPA: NAD(P)/FAD-dependent oxidoreductase [Vicinamibacterales bacterium]
MSDTPHVVIIGGGFGGLFAAKALKRAPVRITLLDRENHHLFQPLLYQVATAGLSPGDIASPIRWVLRHQRNVRVLLAEATRIDTEARCVHLDGGDRIQYDYLIVAAGSSNSYFGHDEWSEVAPSLKTLNDALVIRSRMLLAFEKAEREEDPEERQRLLTFVVVGGGPTGVEMAGAIAEIARQTLADEFRTISTRRSRILLVEAGPSILSTFPEDLRAAAREALIRKGVDVRESTLVTGIEPGRVRLGDETIPAGVVIWAAGVKASPLGQSLGAPLDKAGRVKVEPDLSIPGHPEVFVVGDMAAATDEEGKPYPGVSQVAMQQAAHAAKMIGRSIEGQPRRRFHYKNLGSMATIGRNSAVADLGWLRLAGFPGWLLWLFIHIVWLIGFRNKILVLVQWAGAYITYQRSVRLITKWTGSA